MTEHDCRGAAKVAADAVGLGWRTTWTRTTSQRYVTADGHVRNEGDVEVARVGPYVVSYRAIGPRPAQCPNLLVPVCLSASHIAYGSIRMEPVFMILGQSAATAAVHALQEGRPVQEIDYAKLRARLERDGQVLVPPPRPPSAASRSEKPAGGR